MTTPGSHRGAPQPVKIDRRNPRLVAIAVVVVIAVAAVIVVAVVAGTRSHSPSAGSKLQAGITAAQRGDVQTAKADFQAVVSAEPGNAIAWYDLALIAADAKDDATAEADYDKALDGNPSYVPALFNLAILLTPTDPTRAASLYARAEAAQPTNASVHLNYGFLLIAQGQKQQGQAELAKAVSLDPTLKSRIPASATASPSTAPTATSS